jgi:hypothetical protein
MLGRSRPVIIAFAVTPLAASTVLAAWVFALGLLFKEPQDEMGALVAIFFAASLFLGYLATIVLGLPGYLLFRRIGWVARRHCFLLGAIVGFAEGALLLAVGILGNDDLLANPVAAIGGFALLTAPLVSVMGVLFAWLIRRSGFDIAKIASTFD